MDAVTTSYLAQMAGFGVLGFDPTSTVLAVLSLVVGVGRRQVLAFLGTVLLGTISLGVAVSLTVGRELAELDWHSWLRAGQWPAVVEAVLALALLGWAVRRIRTPAVPASSRTVNPGTGSAVLLGLGLVAAWFADPGFDAAVIRAGSTDSVLATLIGVGVWVSISQSAALVSTLTIALARDPSRLARRIEPHWRATGPARARALTTLLVLAAAILLLDAGWYLVRAHHLPG